MGRNRRKKEKKWYQKTVWIVLLLLFVYPAGLVLAWLNAEWSKKKKIILTIVFGIIFICVYPNGNKDQTQPDVAPSVVTSEADVEETTEVEEKSSDKAEKEPTVEETAEPEPVIEEEPVVEEPVEEEPAVIEDTRTPGQKNAVSKAEQYLRFTAFSYTGLIGQLEYEGFSTEEATYGADNCGADWSEQAVLKAKNYLDFQSFSMQGLIDQLIFEGFTADEAAYGAEQAYK